METISRPVSPLRQRMLDDMRMRTMAEHTQAGTLAAQNGSGVAGEAADDADLREGAAPAPITEAANAEAEAGAVAMGSL